MNVILYLMMLLFKEKKIKMNHFTYSLLEVLVHVVEFIFSKNSLKKDLFAVLFLNT